MFNRLLWRVCFILVILHIPVYSRLCSVEPSDVCVFVQQIASCWFIKPSVSHCISFSGNVVHPEGSLIVNNNQILFNTACDCTVGVHSSLTWPQKILSSWVYGSVTQFRSYSLWNKTYENIGHSVLSGSLTNKWWLTSAYKVAVITLATWFQNLSCLKEKIKEKHSVILLKFVNLTSEF